MEVVMFATKLQYLYLAIHATCFYLREIHNVIATRTGRGERVKVTYMLRRDL
jgi:hypothetical protein